MGREVERARDYRSGLAIWFGLAGVLVPWLFEWGVRGDTLLVWRAVASGLLVLGLVVTLLVTRLAHTKEEKDEKGTKDAAKARYKMRCGVYAADFRTNFTGFVWETMGTRHFPTIITPTPVLPPLLQDDDECQTISQHVRYLDERYRMEQSDTEQGRRGRHPTGNPDAFWGPFVRLQTGALLTLCGDPSDAVQDLLNP